MGFVRPYTRFSDVCNNIPSVSTMYCECSSSTKHSYWLNMYVDMYVCALMYFTVHIVLSLLCSHVAPMSLFCRIYVLEFLRALSARLPLVHYILGECPVYTRTCLLHVVQKDMYVCMWMYSKRVVP